MNIKRKTHIIFKEYSKNIQPTLELCTLCTYKNLRKNEKATKLYRLYSGIFYLNHSIIKKNILVVVVSGGEHISLTQTEI